MFFRNLSLILLLFHGGRCTSSIVLNVNDIKQPLVIARSEENQSLDTVRPMASSNDDDSPNIIFSSATKRLFTACPLNYNNPDVPTMLSETQNNETTCKDTLNPIIYSFGHDHKCGGNQEGVWHSSGYRVHTLKPFLGESIHHAGMYSICYREDQGVLHTWHTIYPGKRAKPLETWTVNKFESGLKLIPKNKFDPDNENIHEIQLVPFDHLKPMAWKMATLLDFNFITANARVKTALDKLDSYLLDYTDQTSNILQIFSGIKLIPETAAMEHIVWYWRMAGNAQHTTDLLFMIADREPKPHEIRCNDAPQENNFIPNTETIPDVIFCEITDSMMDDLNAINAM